MSAVLPLVSIQCTQRCHERFLGDVFGVLQVVDHSSQERQEPILVGEHQFPDRLGVSGFGGLDQLPLLLGIGCGFRHGISPPT